MDQTTIIQIIHHLKESLINSGIKVDSIALFDSVLTGEMHDDSDIDIMLVSVDFEDKDIFERAKLTMFPEIMTFRICHLKNTTR